MVARFGLGAEGLEAVDEREKAGHLTCTPMGPRFVRALSAPTSITSAPFDTICRAVASALATSSVPSPEKESSSGDIDDSHHPGEKL